MVKAGTIIGLSLAGGAILALVLYGKQLIQGAQQLGQTAGQLTAAPVVGFGEGLASSFSTGLNELKTFFGQGTTGNAPGTTTTGSSPGTSGGSMPPVAVTTSNDQLAAELARLQKQINDMNNPNKNPSNNNAPPPPAPPPATSPPPAPSPGSPTSGYSPHVDTFPGPGGGSVIPGIDLGAGSVIQSGNDIYKYLSNLANQSNVVAHPDLTKPVSVRPTVNYQPAPDLFTQISNALKSGIATVIPGVPGVIKPIAPGEIIPGMFG